MSVEQVQSEEEIRASIDNILLEVKRGKAKEGIKGGEEWRKSQGL